MWSALAHARAGPGAFYPTLGSTGGSPGPVSSQRKGLTKGKSALRQSLVAHCFWSPSQNPLREPENPPDLLNNMSNAAMPTHSRRNATLGAAAMHVCISCTSCFNGHAAPPPWPLLRDLHGFFPLSRLPQNEGKPSQGSSSPKGKAGDLHWSSSPASLTIYLTS